MELFCGKRGVPKSMCNYNKKRHSVLTLNSKINCYEMSSLFHKSPRPSFDVSTDNKEQRCAIVCLSALRGADVCGVQHCAQRLLRSLLVESSQQPTER